MGGGEVIDTGWHSTYRLLALADEAAAAWGDALPEETREHIADACHHRLVAVGLIEPHVAAERAVRRVPAA
jgi:hypothetical protein